MPTEYRPSDINYEESRNLVLEGMQPKDKEKFTAFENSSNELLAKQKSILFVDSLMNPSDWTKFRQSPNSHFVLSYDRKGQPIYAVHMGVETKDGGGTFYVNVFDFAKLKDGTGTFQPKIGQGIQFSFSEKPIEVAKRAHEFLNNFFGAVRKIMIPPAKKTAFFQHINQFFFPVAYAQLPPLFEPPEPQMTLPDRNILLTATLAVSAGFIAYPGYVAAKEGVGLFAKLKGAPRLVIGAGLLAVSIYGYDQVKDFSLYYFKKGTNQEEEPIIPAQFPGQFNPFAG